MTDRKEYKGLTSRQVNESRLQHGDNILTPPEREPWWKSFLGKFKDPLIIILCIAGILSIGISCYEYYLSDNATVFFEPVGIFIAILLATGLAFIFEYKADREFAVLNQVNDDEPVRVIRDGNTTEVPRKDIVVGDIVILNTGDEVPADGRLLEATSMSVDESTLTGEPLCHKTTDPDAMDVDATFASDTVMRGTKVMEGHGIMEVTAVGDKTENGKVYVAATIDDSVKTPLDEQLERLGHLISWASYTIATMVVAGRVTMYFMTTPDFEWLSFVTYMLQTVMIVVALIVVSIPEGLPMAVTLSLAYSMRRMLKSNNLVRKLHACETMGATTVICTDKTGTLTQNRMQVAEITFFGKDEGIGDNGDAGEIAQASLALNSTAQLDRTDPANPTPLGNPTEGALLLYLNKAGIDYSDIRNKTQVIAEIPFSTERKYMASEVRLPSGKRMLLVKGAPEIVMAMCPSVAGDIPREKIAEMLTRYQNEAMRTLAFATATLTGDKHGIINGTIVADNLTLDGIVAISDPVRPDVPAAIAECRNAGIDIKIVTGDTPATAREIGRQTGLWDNSTDNETAIITGPEFAALDDDEVRRRANGIKIIARARPLDKKRLVETLQSLNQVVAVTGDGTNDAPALKAAHVGLSMGDGTSVAKEASDITIIDNSFTSIGRAVMWGRSLYRNIRRFILFQMTVNVAACLIVLAGAFMGTETPLTVTQMLWVNLIMDTFAAMALASLPPSPSVMKNAPRRRSDFIISRAMKESIITTGAIFFLILFGLLYVFEHANVTSLADLPYIKLGNADGLTPYELSLFFTIFVMLQFWNMFNARAFGSDDSGLNLSHCGEFNFIAALIVIGQMLIVETGGQFFNVVPLKFTDWIIIILSTSPVLIIGEAIRFIERHKN